MLKRLTIEKFSETIVERSHGMRELPSQLSTRNRDTFPNSHYWESLRLYFAPKLPKKSKKTAAN